MSIPEIRKKLSTQFRGAKTLLDGFGSPGEREATRSEIDLVIRLHMEAEMTKLMTAFGPASARSSEVTSSAMSQHRW